MLPCRCEKFCPQTAATKSGMDIAFGNGAETATGVKCARLAQSDETHCFSGMAGKIGGVFSPSQKLPAQGGKGACLCREVPRTGHGHNFFQQFPG